MIHTMKYLHFSEVCEKVCSAIIKDYTRIPSNIREMIIESLRRSAMNNSGFLVEDKNQNPLYVLVSRAKADMALITVIKRAIYVNTYDPMSDKELQEYVEQFCGTDTEYLGVPAYMFVDAFRDSFLNQNTPFEPIVYAFNRDRESFSTTYRENGVQITESILGTHSLDNIAISVLD